MDPLIDDRFWNTENVVAMSQVGEFHRFHHFRADVLVLDCQAMGQGDRPGAVGSAGCDINLKVDRGLDLP